MGRKVGLTLDRVVETAVGIADRNGIEDMSLRQVADELGIKTPSLYNHVAGLAGLRRELALYAAREVGIIFSIKVPGETVSESLRRLAGEYRRFALEHPGLYQALLPAPRPGEDDELYAAMSAPVVGLRDLLTQIGVPSDETVHLIRALRSVIHGFVDLEMKDGFGMPENIDDSFDQAIDVAVNGILSRVEHPVPRHAVG
jgi:AcrR family transcriptional regulator